jgi:hypothetical protein
LLPTLVRDRDRGEGDLRIMMMWGSWSIYRQIQRENQGKHLALVVNS